MEINPFLGTILGNLFLGFGIIIAIYIINIFKKTIINKIDFLTSITVGLLIGIIFLGFIPEIFESNINGESVGFFILFGLLLFYILELFMHWHHCKDLGNNGCSHGHIDEHKSGNLMFFGTLIHNSFHGVILFTAFSINSTFGIITTISILLHAIPQNIANYIMNHNNLKYPIIAAFGGVFGAIITYPFYEFLISNQFEVLSIITGSLLYTALTDIFPNIKKNDELKYKILYLLFIILGVFIFYIFSKII